MGDRRLIITVPGPAYKVLAEQGRLFVRSPEQQAAFIVRQAVADNRLDRQPAAVSREASL
jgi:hypothetical protein